MTSSVDSRRAAFAGLRERLSAQMRSASPEAFTLAEDSILRSGFGQLDAALGGGFPRGAIATLEGTSGSGRSALAARLLGNATAGGGLGALVELPKGPDGSIYPPALAAAGVDLTRLLIVHANDAADAARAIDIVLRSAAFGVVVMPAVALRATAWARFSSLAHHANAVLLAFGAEAPHELRYFASLRMRLCATDVKFSGSSGLFATLAGIGVQAAVLKHKRAAPGKRARFVCATFESAGAPLTAERTRTISRALNRSAAPA